MEPKSPAFGRIIWTDYTTCLATIFILFSGAALLYDQFVQSLSFSKELPYITAAICVVGIPVITWRLRLIASAFEYGWEVEGDVLDISFFRDRGRVSYIYTVQGERFQSSNAIMKNRITRSLQSGQKVKIVVNRDNPKIAFIRDIYS
jgi:uncharacterized protein DUF3592